MNKIELEGKDIFDLDNVRWYKVRRSNMWPGQKRLILEEQIYTKVRRFPTGNHLCFSDCDGLHYGERGPPPTIPGSKTHSLRKKAKNNE